MLILASQSPRRRELLTQLGYAFRCEDAAIDETRLPAEPPAEMTVRLALLKAQTIFARAKKTEQDGDGVAVLAGDTVVTVGDEILGKPVNREHAAAMLHLLSGKTHQVFTAVALVAAAHQQYALSITDVTFDRLSEAQVQRYCDSGEPMDKAGGYAIQAGGGAFVTHMSGSYSGVVGLPLHETAQLLRAFYGEKS